MQLDPYAGLVSAFAAQKQKDLDNSYAVADTTAARESSDYEAAANQQTAAQTNSLAQRLASARRTPGGGIRMGIKQKRFNAAAAGSGLNSANARERLNKRRDELRAQAKQRVDAAHQYDNNYSISFGAPIQLW